MRIDEITKNGIYIALRFDLASCKKLAKWTNDLGIKSIEPEKMHSTVLTIDTPKLTYDYFKPNKKLDVEIDLDEAEFDVFPLRSTDSKALVVKLNSEWIEDFRQDLIDRYEITKTNDVEPFIPHLSLSYEWPEDSEIDIKSLTLPIDTITIVSEYKERPKER